MSRLKREGNPPSNQLASPVPQAWDPSINDFREITGQNLGGGRFGTDGVQWGKTASGLFMPIRVTNDGVQEVQLSGNIPLETVIFSRTGVIGGNVVEVIADIKQPCELCSFSIGSNYPNIYAVIGSYSADGGLNGYLRLPGRDGQYMFEPSALNVQQHADGENDFWRVAVYDEANNRFVLTMKRSIRFNNGVKITIHNYSDVEQTCGVNLAIAKWR